MIYRYGVHMLYVFPVFQHPGEPLILQRTQTHPLPCSFTSPVITCWVTTVWIHRVSHCSVVPLLETDSEGFTSQSSWLVWPSFVRLSWHQLEQYETTPTLIPNPETSAVMKLQGTFGLWHWHCCVFCNLMFSFVPWRLKELPSMKQPWQIW